MRARRRDCGSARRGRARRNEGDDCVGGENGTRNYRNMMDCLTERTCARNESDSFGIRGFVRVVIVVYISCVGVRFCIRFRRFAPYIVIFDRLCRSSERRSGGRTLEADGIQLLRRVEGGEQTGAVTETEKKEIDDLSRRAFFFCSLEHLL